MKKRSIAILGIILALAIFVTACGKKKAELSEEYQEQISTNAKETVEAIPDSKYVSRTDEEALEEDVIPETEVIIKEFDETDSQSETNIDITNNNDKAKVLEKSTVKETIPGEMATKETVPEDTNSQETNTEEPKTTETPDADKKDESSGTVSYVDYINMSAEDQHAFFNTFDTVDGFFVWYNNAKEVYESEAFILEGEAVDIGEFGK